MHHAHRLDKNKQIEYINQYYNQLQQEKLVNKKTIEEALRKQNFDYEHIQMPQNVNTSRPRQATESENHFVQPSNPSHRHEDTNPSDNYRSEYRSSEYPPITRTGTPTPEQTRYREGDFQRDHERSSYAPRYVEQIPQLSHYQYPTHPQVTDSYFYDGDQPQYVYESPKGSTYTPTPLYDRIPLPHTAPVHCGGDQRAISNVNGTHYQPAIAHRCQCHSYPSVKTLKNRIDQIHTQDLRTEWLNTYQNARMERKNNIQKNR